MNKMIIIASIILLILFSMLVFIIVVNRENNQVVQIGIKVLVVSVITALVLVVFELISFLPPDQKEINVLILRNKDNLNVYDFNFHLLKVGSKHKNGYEQLNNASFFPKKDIKDIDKELITRDLLEMAFWLWLSKKYHLHWQVNEEFFEGISGWEYTQEKFPNAEKNITKITPEKLQEILVDNIFQVNKGQFWGVSLPSNTSLNVTYPSEHERIIEIKNMHIDFVITIKSVGNSGVTGTILGDAIAKTLPEPDQWYSNNFKIKFTCSYTKWLRGSTRAKQLKRWTTQIMSDFQNDFEWNLIKEDLEKAYRRS